MAYAPRNKRIGSIRLDNILSIQTAGNCESYDTYRQKLDQMQKHIWGVSTEGGCARLEQVEFTLRLPKEAAGRKEKVKVNVLLGPGGAALRQDGDVVTVMVEKVEVWSAVEVTWRDTEI